MTVLDPCYNRGVALPRRRERLPQGRRSFYILKQEVKNYRLQQNQKNGAAHRGGAALWDGEAWLHALPVPRGQGAKPEALRRPLPPLRLRRAWRCYRPHGRAARLLEGRGGMSKRREHHTKGANCSRVKSISLSLNGGAI